MQLDLGGLPGPVGNEPGGDQTPARFLDCVVVTLPDRAGVFRAGLLAQGVQDGLDRLRAALGQVTVQPACPAQRGPQPHLPVLEPGLAVTRVWAQALPHLRGQRPQVRQVRAARGSRQQDQVRVLARGHRQRIGPVTHLPRPRQRDSPRGQGVTHRAVRVETPHPRHRGGGGRVRDPGLPPQPRPRRPATVILKTAVRVERRQDRRPGGDVHRRGPLQRTQALRLHHRRRRRQVS